MVNVGDKVEGTIIRLTIGEDLCTYATMRFDKFHNATVRMRRDDEC